MAKLVTLPQDAGNDVNINLIWPMLLKSSPTAHKNEPSNSYWYTDSSAFSHMANDATQLTQSTSYLGNDQVLIGNCDTLSITHIGSLKPTHSLSLHDVLVI